MINLIDPLRFRGYPDPNSKHDITLDGTKWRWTKGTNWEFVGDYWPVAEVPKP